MRVEQNSDLDDRSCLISDALITREVVGAWIKNQQRAGRFAHVRQGDPRGLDEIGEGKPTLGVVVAGANGGNWKGVRTLESQLFSDREQHYALRGSAYVK